MRVLIQIIVILIVSFLLQTFLPWWTMTIGAFIIGYLFAHSGWKSFFAGFIGVGLLWVAMAFYIDQASHSILTEKVARLFPTQTIPLLFILTALIGGLAGGMATLTGSVLSYRPKRW